ncbi:hypothetical protein K1719_026610 [Acacia pycnantha]|nr:hypothetical protein K1719_026610 [Acacia pycnantha]
MSLHATVATGANVTTGDVVALTNKETSPPLSEDCLRSTKKALTGGPWMIFGAYLTIQPWSLDFDSRASTILKVVVWVRLPGLSSRYYHKSTLRVIGALLGDVIKIDYMTKSRGRGKYARMAVLIDLQKSLVPAIKVDVRSYGVEYEGLPHICFACDKYGHTKDRCASGAWEPSGMKVKTMGSSAGNNEDPRSNQDHVGSISSRSTRPWAKQGRAPTSLGASEEGMSKTAVLLSSAFRALEASSTLASNKHTVVTLHSTRPVLEETNPMALDGPMGSQSSGLISHGGGKGKEN